MKLLINLPADRSKAQMLKLKQHIEQYPINQLEELDFERQADQSGTLSALNPITGSLLAVIALARNPITELVKCLQTYIAKYRTEIEIVMENGKSVKLRSDNIEKDEKVVQLIINSMKQ